MQCSMMRKLVVVVPFSADQSVFGDLQEFFQDSNIKTVNHNVYSNNCKLLYFSRLFFAENILSTNLKVHFLKWRVRHYGILTVTFHCDVLFEIDFEYSTKESENKDSECIFRNGKFYEDEQREIWIKCFSWTLAEQRTQYI